MPAESALTLDPGLHGGLDVARAKKPAGKAAETIGERLARLRRERGLTQVELGERLGVTQSHVSEWERGNLRLHGELIVEIARLLQVSADQLL